MTLKEEWKSIVKKAWSIRLMAAAFIFTAAEAALPFLGEDLPPRLFAALSGLAVAGAFVSRLVVQRDVE